MDLFQYSALEVPSVLATLKNILTQYPDNGQIIKELLQNAEDAGASRVELVHDARTLDFPEVHESIRRFIKGPALCLYNNAVFSKEDWQGIRKLNESIKKDDPLKVGQFGLGFKSIFHITDFITIISGTQVLFIDPFIKPDSKMCCLVDLGRLGQFVSVPTCLKIWGAYLFQKHLEEGNFPATIFWFPLRQQPSQLSSTVYSSDSVSRLFDSFIVEAPMCLIFLKALEHVSLKRVVKKSSSPIVLNQVELRNPNPAMARQELRQRLCECRGCPEDTITCSYYVTIHTTTGEEVKRQTMLVLHLLPGKQDAYRVKYGGKECSRHMPLVGVAVPTDPPATSCTQGHLFTFLPLPTDPANTTGLPVHVNAYFVLDQNRRHIKWRTKNTTMEADVMWNEELVSQVVLEAYYKLVEKAHREVVHGDDWYCLLPDLGTTVGRWDILARQLWRRILHLPIIYTQNQGMHKIQEVVTVDSLNLWSPLVAESVCDVLRQAQQPLASLPPHIDTSLRSLGASPPSVTPQLVRDALRSSGVSSRESHRLALLDYVSSDSNHHDLAGLLLLPLGDGSWITFFGSDRCAREVYICTAEQAGALLGLEARLLSRDLSSDLLQKLRSVAQAGC